MKYAFVQDHSKEYKITRICDVLEVSPSGYYAWRGRPESKRAKQNRLEEKGVRALIIKLQNLLKNNSNLNTLYVLKEQL